MRRLSGITLQVEAPGRGAGRPSSARSRPMPPAARRSRWRWPGALQSALWRRLSLALLLLLAAAVGLALFPGQKVIGKALAWSARAGFRVDDIFVEGRNRTPPEQLLAALAVKRGDAIFAVDLAQARRRLEQIPWVRSATVERRLPDQIHLLISERAPIALWQSKGRYFLVDADGQIVGDQIEDYAGLPLTVGEGAPDQAAALVALLQAEPALAERVKASAWVGERRWNLTLDRAPGGIEIRLPEEAPVEAWHELARLERNQSLLERQISVVDMRLPDRLVLRAAGAAGAAGEPESKSKPVNGKDA